MINLKVKLYLTNNQNMEKNETHKSNLEDSIGIYKFIMKNKIYLLDSIN